jgi:hypothetical protein
MYVPENTQMFSPATLVRKKKQESSDARIQGAGVTGVPDGFQPDSSCTKPWQGASAKPKIKG